MSIRTIGIIGPRDMEDKELPLRLIHAIVEGFKGNRCEPDDHIQILTVGSDQGFGSTLKKYWKANPDLLAQEISVFFFGDATKRVSEDYLAAFRARHTAIPLLAEEVHIMHYSKKRSLVEDVIQKVKDSTVNYYVYDERGYLTDYRASSPETNASKYQAHVTEVEYPVPNAKG